MRPLAGLGAQVALAAVCWTLPAIAQSGVRLRTQVSQTTVEQGQTFQLELSALVESGQPVPSSPRLPAPPGAVVHGPSMSTQQQVVMRGGTIEQRHGFTATWSITPTKTGQLRVGPPSVLVGSKQYQGDAVVVTVLPPGQGPGTRRAPGGLPSDPFDFFRRRRGSLLPPGLFDDPLGDDPFSAPSPFVPDYPAEYAVKSAPDSIAFLRSKLDKTSAVVGEQVTLSIYAYGSQGPFREMNANEPNTAAFVTFPIVDNSYNEQRYQVDIGDEIWQAVKVREVALFPIRTGNLELGKMRMGFYGRGYPAHGNQVLTRESALLTLKVTEPPLQGRPSGYRIGDVGRYQLSAEVEPRTVRQGDAVSVSVTLKGTGNLPLKLDVPQQAGVEWLEPQVRGEVAPQNSIVQGSRHFQYVVRLNKAGSVDLGELRLPYWDPGRNAYHTARAALGSIQVSPSAAVEAKQMEQRQAQASRLSGAMKARTTLGEAPRTRAPFTDSAWFWTLLGLGPVMVTVAGISARVARQLGQKVASRREDVTKLASRALQDAQAQLDQGNPEAALAEAERALFLAIEAATGLKARGLLRTELPQRLTERNVDPEIAHAVNALFAQCETARFTGQTQGDEAARIVATAKDVTARLTRLRRARNPSKAS